MACEIPKQYYVFVTCDWCFSIHITPHLFINKSSVFCESYRLLGLLQYRLKEKAFSQTSSSMNERQRCHPIIEDLIASSAFIAASICILSHVDLTSQHQDLRWREIFTLLTVFLYKEAFLWQVLDLSVDRVVSHPHHSIWQPSADRSNVARDVVIPTAV